MHRISCCTLFFNYLNHHLFRKHPSEHLPTGERITRTSRGYGIAGICDESSRSSSVRRRRLDKVGGGIFHHRTPFFPPRGNRSLSPELQPVQSGVTPPEILAFPVARNGAFQSQEEQGNSSPRILAILIRHSFPTLATR